MQAAGVEHPQAQGLPNGESVHRFDELLALGLAFVSPAKIAETARSWLPRNNEAATDDEVTRQQVHAMALAMNLVLFTPSASGATAFDRVARSGRFEARDAATVRGLCRARFRFVAVEAVAADGTARLRDQATGEVFTVADAMPQAAQGLDLVGWFDPADPALSVAPIPLDGAARAVVLGFVKQGKLVTPLRCADSVFRHIVRHGTLEVQGLNGIPADEDDEQASEDELDVLASAWADGAACIESDVHYIRSRSGLDDLLEMMADAAYARNPRKLREAYERIAWIQLQAIHRRALAGSGSLRLEIVAAAVSSREAAGDLPPGTQAMFMQLRNRLGDRPRAADGGNLDRLLARIQGLRAKTVEQGCTEQEALTAAAKVAELLDRYGLSLSELELKQQSCEGSAIETGRKRMSPLDDCVPYIAQFFDTRTWGEKKPDGTVRHIFFGMPADVAACRYLYDLVALAFDTETAAFRIGKDYPTGASGLRRTATNSFQIGLGAGVSAKLQIIRAERETVLRGSSGRDLVVAKAGVVEDELAALGLSLRRRSSAPRRRVMTKVFEQGRKTGMAFEYTPGIGREGAG